MNNDMPLSKNSTSHLKNIVEQSLAVLRKNKDSTETTPRSAPLLRRRTLPLYVDAANLEKRALTDAANALSVLWKVSKPSRTRVPSRALQPSRQTS
jgi:hypothetical protein